MSQKRRIILDANILIRAILGQKAYRLLEGYGQTCSFLTPELCALEAEKHLTSIVSKKGMDVQTALEALHALFNIVQILPPEVYETYKSAAMARISHRDSDDWPLVALSLVLDCPIWTEDGDFFGVGIATWQTRNVEIFLKGE